MTQGLGGLTYSADMTHEGRARDTVWKKHPHHDPGAQWLPSTPFCGSNGPY